MIRLQKHGSNKSHGQYARPRLEVCMLCPIEGLIGDARQAWSCWQQGLDRSGLIVCASMQAHPSPVAYTASEKVQSWGSLPDYTAEVILPDSGVLLLLRFSLLASR